MTTSIGIVKHPQYGRFEKMDASFLRRKWHHIQAFANRCILPPIKEDCYRIDYPSDYVEVIITQPMHSLPGKTPKIYIEERFYKGLCIDRRDVAEFTSWDAMKAFVAGHYGILSGVNPRKERKQQAWW